MFDVILIIIGIMLIIFVGSLKNVDKKLSLILVIIGIISILIMPVKYFWISLLIWGILLIYLLVKYAGKK